MYLQRSCTQLLYALALIISIVPDGTAQPFSINSPPLSNLSSFIPQNVPVPAALISIIDQNVPFGGRLLKALISPSPAQTPSLSPSESPIPSNSPLSTASSSVMARPSDSPLPTPSSSAISWPSNNSSMRPSPSQSSFLPPQSPSTTPSIWPLDVLSTSPSQLPSIHSSPLPSLSTFPQPPVSSPSSSSSLQSPTPFFSPQTQPSPTSPPSSSPTPSPTPSQSASVSNTPSPSPSTSSPCLSGCRCESPGQLEGEPSFNETELQAFGASQSSVFFVSDFPAGDVFRSTWDKQLVSWDGTKLSISVQKRSDGSLYGGEIRTNSHWYGYGCVSACMQPIAVSGIITSLFTYTGKFDGIGGSTPNHNEIDIEFEGADTTKVQFNYYTDDDFSAVQRNEFDFDLGFDASQSFNVYGFRWTPWGIELEVNGQIARQVSNDNGNTTPIVTANTVQKVMANAWVVPLSTEPFFGGTFDLDGFSSASAEYKWIRYQKLNEYGCCSISPSC